jgi:DNA-binding NarL/FixJ family response regulator
MIAVTDTEKYLYYSPAITLDAGIQIGQPFLAEDLFGEIIRNKTRAEQISPPQYGPPFRAVGYPIFSSTGEVIGGLGFGMSLGKEVFLGNAIHAVRSLVKKQTESIVSLAYELNDTLAELPTYGEVLGDIPPARTPANAQRTGSATRVYQELRSMLHITDWETEILTLLNAGKTYAEIGLALSLSPQTIKNYISQIYSKFGVRNKVEAMHRAQKMGLFET